MFYRPGVEPSGLPHSPLKAMVVPRPIGWISTVDAEGRPNLAPYSFFNAISDRPPMVMYTTGPVKPDQSPKDTITNIRATGEFCVNLCGEALRDAMNASAAHVGAGENEFERAGLETAPCEVISVPRVKAAPGALECRLWKIIDLPGGSLMAIGEVVGIHLDDALIVDGRFDAQRWKPLTRLGYMDYAVVEETFSMLRPDAV